MSAPIINRIQCCICNLTLSYHQFGTECKWHTGARYSIDCLNVDPSLCPRFKEPVYMLRNSCSDCFPIVVGGNCAVCNQFVCMSEECSVYDFQTGYARLSRHIFSFSFWILCDLCQLGSVIARIMRIWWIKMSKGPIPRGLKLIRAEPRFSTSQKPQAQLYNKNSKNKSQSRHVVYCANCMSRSEGTRWEWRSSRSWWLNKTRRRRSITNFNICLSRIRIITMGAATALALGAVPIWVRAARSIRPLFQCLQVIILPMHLNSRH